MSKGIRRIECSWQWMAPVRQLQIFSVSSHMSCSLPQAIWTHGRLSIFSHAFKDFFQATQAKPFEDDIHPILALHQRIACPSKADEFNASLEGRCRPSREETLLDWIVILRHAGGVDRRGRPVPFPSVGEHPGLAESRYQRHHGGDIGSFLPHVLAQVQSAVVRGFLERERPPVNLFLDHAQDPRPFQIPGFRLHPAFFDIHDAFLQDVALSPIAARSHDARGQ